MSVRPYADMRQAQIAFANAVNSMAKLTGFDRKGIVTAEAGSVLKKCFGETKVAGDDSITKGARLRTLRTLGLTGGPHGPKGDITINAGVKAAPYGRVFLRKNNGDGFRRTHGAGFQPVWRHYKDATWQRLQNAIDTATAAIQAAIPQAKQAAGLARQSWVLIADSLGIRLESVPGGSASAGAIGKARAATAKGGKNRNNGRSLVSSDPNRFSITFINALPWGRKIGFQQTMAAAITGRAKFFAMAMAKGYRGSLEQTTKLFPGWKVK